MGTQITVISGGSAEPGLDFVAEAFRKKTGHEVRIIYNTGEQMIGRMKKGEVFDVVITTIPLANFRAIGKVEEGGMSIGRVRLGAMVRPGAPVPDISSVDALERAVLEAESVVYTTSSSGRCIEAMLGKMGIYERVEEKVTRFATAHELMDHVLGSKRKELGFLPVTEILTYKEKGLVLVGALPEKAQYYLELVAVPSTDARNLELAWEFVRFCSGEGRPLLVENGVS